VQPQLYLETLICIVVIDFFETSSLGGFPLPPYQVDLSVPTESTRTLKVPQCTRDRFYLPTGQVSLLSRIQSLPSCQAMSISSAPQPLKILHIRFMEWCWLGGSCGEAGATHLTGSRAELQTRQTTDRLHMSPAILARPAARHPAERVVSALKKGKWHRSCCIVRHFVVRCRCDDNDATSEIRGRFSTMMVSRKLPPGQSRAVSTQVAQTP
jgi:hypothetical protein